MLDPNSPEIATSLENLGVLHSSSGDHPAAAALFTEALAIRERTVGRTHPNALNTLYRLGRALHMAGDREQARRLLDEWEAEVAKLPPDAARADDLIHLAEQLHYRREYARAEPLYRQALAARRALFGERHASVAAALQSLGILMHDQRKFAEAEPLLRQAVEIQKAVRPSPDADLARMYGSLGRTLLNRNSLNEAESLLREAVAREPGANQIQHAGLQGGGEDASFRADDLGQADGVIARTSADVRHRRALRYFQRGDCLRRRLFGFPLRPIQPLRALDAHGRRQHAAADRMPGLLAREAGSRQKKAGHERRTNDSPEVTSRTCGHLEKSKHAAQCGAWDFDSD